jgi:hypothetical protein
MYQEKEKTKNKRHLFYFKTSNARHWWLTPIILATQEAEIRRITVRSQPPANSSGDPILKKPITKKKTKNSWWIGSRCRP